MNQGHGVPGPSVRISAGVASGTMSAPRIEECTYRESRMSFITTFLASLRRDEEGQGLAEYALILALIAIVAIVALIFLGGQVSTILSKVGTSV